MGFKEKVLGSFFWSFAERFGQQGIQFFFSIALARLLVPSDFGIIGMITVFVLLPAMVVDSGFGQALVQKKEISDTDTNTVFWFSMALGVVMTGLIYLSAPWIAAFYDQPILKPITRLIAFQVLINSSSVVQRGLLQRELLFRLRAQMTLMAVTLSGVISVIMAYYGFGVWSLAWLSINYMLFMNIGIWLLYPWRPGFMFSTSSFRALYHFGSKVFAAGVLDTVFVNLLPILIGKFYTPASLGFYTRAQNLVRLVSNSISGVLGQVNFPILSRMAHDREQIVKVFSKVLVFSVMIIAPPMFGLMAAGPEIIEVLLGAKWLPTVPYLIPASLIGIAYPIQYLNHNVLMALGRSDVFLKLEIIRKTVVAVCLALTVTSGVLPMVWGQTGAALIGMTITIIILGRFLNYGLLKQIRDFGIILLICAAMGLVVYGIGRVALPLLIKFALQFGCGAGSYAAMLYLYALMAPSSVCGELISQGKAHLSEYFAGRRR